MGEGVTRRRVVRNAALGAGAVWAAPVTKRVLVGNGAGSPPPPTSTSSSTSSTSTTVPARTFDLRGEARATTRTDGTDPACPPSGAFNESVARHYEIEMDYAELGAATVVSDSCEVRTDPPFLATKGYA